MCRAQGATSLKCWTETRSDTVKTKHMIDNYINVVGEDAAIGRQKPGRKPPCPWRIVEYFKTTFQKTEVVRDSQGKMMWEEEYYEFAQTAAGHKLGDAQARKNWAEWKRQKDEHTDSLVWDLLGPERAPLQLWVHTGKFLTYRDTQGESNRVERSGKQLKKATQEDIEKLEKMAFNTNEFGENDEHLHDTARRMVQQSSNSGSALGGRRCCSATFGACLRTMSSEASRHLEMLLSTTHVVVVVAALLAQRDRQMPRPPPPTLPTIGGTARVRSTAPSGPRRLSTQLWSRAWGRPSRTLRRQSTRQI